MGASRRFLQATLDALSFHIAILDETGTILLVNDAWRQFGRKNGLRLPADGEGCNYLTVCDGVSGADAETARAMARAIRQLLAREHPAAHLEYPCDSPTEQRWFLAHVTGFDDDGMVRVVIAHENITERKQAERQREELLRFLSHDMRSPQASILALLDMREGHGDGLTDGERFARIGAYARRTLELAEDFVNIARAENLAHTALGDVDLAEVAHEACDETWALANGKRITLARRIADEAWIRGDGALLRRALFNVLDNAIKYSPNDTMVEVEVVRDGGVWRCTVRDQGVGIAPDVVPRLFRRFARAATGHGGVGLGLALAKTVAHSHGGDLTVESRLGEGSVFTMSIPATTPASIGRDTDAAAGNADR